MIRVILFLIGVFSLTLFIGWALGLFLFVFGGSSFYGSIAYLPKWIFLLSIFLVFTNQSPFKNFFSKSRRSYSKEGIIIPSFSLTNRR